MASPESATEELHAVIELGSIDSQRLIDGVGQRTQPPLKSLSSAQMESLSALCDTFLPSINVSNGTTIDDDSLATFYRTSATMAGTQHRVEELIMVKLQHPKLFLMRLTLWFLSTWIGTLILCGRASLSSHFPYFQRFSKVSQQKREEIVHSWSVSFIYLLRMFFLSAKFLILLTFFTQVYVHATLVFVFVFVLFYFFCDRVVPKNVETKKYRVRDQHKNIYIYIFCLFLVIFFYNLYKKKNFRLV
ncbi:hypothetical protein CsSME_00044301 [Camellia sinensis var. sinensis]